MSGLVTDPSAAAAATLNVIVEALRSYRFRFANESDLQAGIGEALRAGGIAHEREVRLSPHDRIDFLAGRIGIEVKVHGSSASVGRQLSRYAAHGSIDGLILVTDRVQAGAQPATLNGKPLVIVPLLSGLR